MTNKERIAEKILPYVIYTYGIEDEKWCKELPCCGKNGTTYRHCKKCIEEWLDAEAED